MVLRSRARGVTLIEVMIVVVILGMIASAVALAVFPQHLKAQIRMTRIAAKTLRSAASVWRMENGSELCPTPERLREDQYIDTGSKLTDAWDTPYRIECRDRETVVKSLGPDRKESEDDLVEPEPIATL
ncbi:MAG: prepilin-type N-terminal cleavage/methylation domain-containing protein [Polyangiaceae bacterium]|jgi:general secretion pathway protein G